MPGHDECIQLNKRKGMTSVLIFVCLRAARRCLTGTLYSFLSPGKLKNNNVVQLWGSLSSPPSLSLPAHMISMSLSLCVSSCGCSHLSRALCGRWGPVEVNSLTCEASCSMVAPHSAFATRTGVSQRLTPMVS
eukprot:3440144-Amphidinium_carterae.1